MKKILYLLLIIGLPLLIKVPASAQARLKIVEIDSFPQFPGDTAYQGVIYPHIKIKVTNVGTSGFWGDIHVYLYSQTIGPGGTDTLRDDPTHPNIPLLPNAADTVSLQGNPLYSFRTIHYAAGDNIVVVWPYSGPTDFDFYQTRTYFSPLVGIDELTKTVVNTYPNPASGILRLNFSDENKVEQVRIYDPVGREIYHVDKAVYEVDVSRFVRGLYFLEIIEKDGTRSAKKILIVN